MSKWKQEGVVGARTCGSEHLHRATAASLGLCPFPRICVLTLLLGFPPGDLSKPVYRHLAERKWRKDGELAILVSFILSLLRLQS